MQLSSHGLGLTVPGRWEAAIGRGRNVDTDAIIRHRRTTGTAPVTPPTLHLATFPLPADRDDYGTNLVGTMGVGNAFVALLEFGPAEVGTALFAQDGVPRRLNPGDLSAKTLQRSLPGHLGFQAFATEAGRAFALYVVVNGPQHRTRLVADVNAALSTLTIEAAT